MPPKKRKSSGTSSDKAVGAALRALPASGPLPDDTRSLLYGITRPCNGQSRCRDPDKNPSCLCALRPLIGTANSASRRKRGELWRFADADACAAAVLGQDPSDDLRGDSTPGLAPPVGLRNLGATCYVNSVLQCLAMNTPFCRALVALPQAPTATATDTNEAPCPDAMLYRLQELFVQLTLGLNKVADPTELITALQLDHSVQQDGHEFMKLLLTVLSSRLALLPGAGDAAKVVPRLFCGRSSYTTTCEGCKRMSASSMNAVDFYELELSVCVRGETSLKASLAQYLGEERLDGDNQYQCDFCGHRTDATRRVRLHSLPPYLCFQLKRFVFDMQSFERKKVTDAFSFPEALDLSAHVEPLPVHVDQGGVPASPSSQLYELAAILIHQGTNATGGHYVAHVKHESTAQWWCFDDTNVTRLDRGPLRAPTRTSNAAGEREAPACAMQNQLIAASCQSPSAVDDPQASEPRAQKMLSSKDAYLLIYRRRSDEGPASACEPNFCTERAGAVPTHLAESMHAANAAMQAAAATYGEERKRLAELVRTRRAQVEEGMQIMAAPMQSPAQPFHWIDAAWLQSWADGVQPSAPTLRTGHLVCEHGAADPAKVAMMKRISVAGWDWLLARHPLAAGSTALSGSRAFCDPCLRQNAKSVATTDNAADERNSFVLLVNQALDHPAVPRDEQRFAVSRTWLLNWRRRSGSIPEHPAEKLVCQHGGLRPQAGSKEKRVLLPEHVWRYLLREWQAGMHERSKRTNSGNAKSHPGMAMQAKPDSVDVNNTIQKVEQHSDELPSALPTRALERAMVGFPEDTEDCEMCSSLLLSTAQQTSELRAGRADQSAALPELAAGVSCALEVGTMYYLVPSDWLQAWRKFVNATALPPERFDQAGSSPLQALLCARHAMLGCRLPPVERKRGKWVLAASETLLTVVTEAQWLSITSFYGYAAQPLRLTLRQLPDADTPVAVAPAKGPGGRGCGRAAVDDEYDFESPVKPVAVECVSDPCVCEDCIATDMAAARAASLVYTDEVLRVQVKHKTDESTAAAARVSVVGRASKRTRREPGGSRTGAASLTVSSFTTLKSLQLQVLERFDAHPLDQELWYDGTQLHITPEATLGACGVVAGDSITVLTTNEHDTSEAAVAGLFSDLDTKPVRWQSASTQPTVRESGFTGTGLVGLVAPGANTAEPQAIELVE